MNKRIKNTNPKVNDFRNEVIEGLKMEQKYINPKFFYDDEGSKLFDLITSLPEYYPTETEISILRDRCSELKGLTDGTEEGIELGSGSGKKGAILLNCLQDLKKYVLVDISLSALESALLFISERFPEKEFGALCIDYMIDDFMGAIDGIAAGKRLLIFLGSTIGNIEPSSARNFLMECRKQMESGDRLLIGVDLKKDVSVIEKAYNDSQGITARFNLNIIERMRRELGVEIPEKAFSHMAFYNREIGRIEMHLKCNVDFSMEFQGERIDFRKGETIHTENSYKYSIDEIEEILHEAGFSRTSCLTDQRKYYGIFISDP